MNNNYKKWIDISKGIGILLVEFSHFGGFPYFWVTGPFYVSIFFIISGYTYKDYGITYKEFIIKKAKRLLVPYLFFNVIYWVINIILNHNLFINTVAVLYSRYCLYPWGHKDNVIFFSMLNNAPTWFLTAMFATFVFFKKLSEYDHVKQWLIIAAFIPLTYFLNKLPVLLPWSIDCALLFAVFMFIGYRMKDMEDLFFKQKKIILVLLFIALATVHYFLTRYNGNTNLSVRVLGKSVFVLILTASTGSCLCMMVSKCIENNFLGTLLSVIGKHSMSIFCTHLIIFTVISKLLPVPGLKNFNHFPMNIAMVIATTTICIQISRMLKKRAIIV
jgi:fucose 4-O-acetylase-like acetyltransferase